MLGSPEILNLEKQFFNKSGTVTLYSTRGVKPLSYRTNCIGQSRSARESNLVNIINGNPGTYYYVFAQKLAGSNSVPVYYSLYSNPQITMEHSDIFKFISSVLLGDTNIQSSLFLNSLHLFLCQHILPVTRHSGKPSK